MSPRAERILAVAGILFVVVGLVALGLGAAGVGKTRANGRDAGNPPSSERATDAGTAPPETRPAGVDLPTSPVHAAPVTIARDCSVDVTDALNAWLSTVPDNSVARLARDGCYLVGGTIRLVARARLVLDGQGAVLREAASSTSTAALLEIVGGNDLGMQDLEVRGANPAAGATNAAIVEALEHRHAFSIRGSERVVLERVRASDVYGDFVYIAGLTCQYPEVAAQCASRASTWSRGISVLQSTFERGGRQGIAIVAAEQVLVAASEIADVPYSIFDLEPNGSREGAPAVELRDNVTGRAGLYWLAGLGAGNEVRDVVVSGNVMREPTAWLVGMYGVEGGARGPIRIERNRVLVDHIAPLEGAFFFSRCADVVVRDNTGAFPVETANAVAHVQYAERVTVAGNRITGSGAPVVIGVSSSEISGTT